MPLDSHEGSDGWKDQYLDVEYLIGTLTQIENCAFHSCRRAGGCMVAVPAVSPAPWEKTTALLINCPSSYWSVKVALLKTTDFALEVGLHEEPPHLENKLERALGD